MEEFTIDGSDTSNPFQQMFNESRVSGEEQPVYTWGASAKIRNLLLGFNPYEIYETGKWMPFSGIYGTHCF